MIYHAPAHIAMAELADESVDVIVTDPPYNTGNTENKVDGYDQSESIINQKWKNFYSSWDAIPDMWGFTRQWLAQARRILKPGGSLFVFGSHHNIPITDLCLKQAGWWVVQWIAWCIPNAFPQRKMIQQVSANQVIIHARKGQSPRHIYQVERAKDYASLDTWRRTGILPRKRTNLRDFWMINNDGRAAARYPFLVHGAKKPPEVVARCIDITLPEEGGMVFDPFLGSGTTLEVCQHLNDWIITPREALPSCSGSDLYLEYARMAALRCEEDITPLAGGLSLPENDRAAIAKDIGSWSSYILYGDLRGQDMARIVRLWDKPGPKLSRPRESVRTGESAAIPNFSEQPDLLSLWEEQHGTE